MNEFFALFYLKPSCISRTNEQHIVHVFGMRHQGCQALLNDSKHRAIISDLPEACNNLFCTVYSLSLSFTMRVEPSNSTVFRKCILIVLCHRCSQWQAGLAFNLLQQDMEKDEDQSEPNAGMRVLRIDI